MPDYRAMPWMDSLCRRKTVRVAGTYMMFTHDLDFDHEQLARFVRLTDETKRKGLPLGVLHAAPSFEVFVCRSRTWTWCGPGTRCSGTSRPTKT